MPNDSDPGWETLIPGDHANVFFTAIVRLRKWLLRNPLRVLITLVLATWFVREVCRSIYFTFEHRALIAMDSNPEEYSGPFTLDQVAAQNVGAIAVQMLKTDEQGRYRWRIAKPETLDLQAFYGPALLGEDGQVVLLFDDHNWFPFESEVSVLFYLEMGQYQPAFQFPDSQLLGERIANGYSGVRKIAFGELSPYVHSDMSKPLILLQLQLEEDVGKANSPVFVVGIARMYLSKN